MEKSQQLLTTIMQDYSAPQYKDLYKEILIDYNYRFPKFHPIPYPSMNDYINKESNKTGNSPTLKQPPVWSSDLQRQFQK